MLHFDACIFLIIILQKFHFIIIIKQNSRGISAAVLLFEKKLFYKDSIDNLVDFSLELYSKIMICPSLAL